MAGSTERQRSAHHLATAISFLGSSWSSALLKHGYSLSMPFTMPRITEDLTLLCVLTFSSSVKLQAGGARKGVGQRPRQRLLGWQRGPGTAAAGGARGVAGDTRRRDPLLEQAGAHCGRGRLPGDAAPCRFSLAPVAAAVSPGQ